jgi:acetylornithine deacetylase/succinyl-diaminopimelate desuccinylase-like protein
VIVIADSGNAAVEVPALTTSLRGIVDAMVDVRMLERPVHSGVYGGPVGDALTALCRLLATLHDDHGDVAIDGLHTATSAAAVSERTFRADAGVLPGVQLMGSGSITDRTWARPAATVIAIDAPPTNQASNILLPHARAMISVRLAPGDNAQTAMKALVGHLESNAPDHRRRLRRRAFGVCRRLRQRGRRDRHRRDHPVHRRVRPRLSGCRCSRHRRRRS